MEIHIFSDKKNIAEYFPSLTAKSDLIIQYHGWKKLDDFAKNPQTGCFIYVDIDKLNEKTLKKVLKLLNNIKGIYYGIIDPSGAIDDIAWFFHSGASDYLGKKILKAGISKKRLQETLDFLTWEPEEPKEALAMWDFIPSGSDWSNVKKGNTYTFTFMFIELDQKKAQKKTFGDRAMKNPLAPFRNFVERHIAPVNGRIWMWMDYGGLILFPFDGENCDAILTCFRMILDRKIFSIEESEFNSIISYRIVLHLGNTVYQDKGETGTIVSDSINTIFHIVHKFAKPGNFYLTSEIFKLTPEKIRDMFVPAGNFEDNDLMRMKLPV